MINQINDTKINFPDNHYGRKLLSLYKAYGTKYDFCKFYSCNNDYLGIFNSNAVFTGTEISDIDELTMFFYLNSPTEIEMPFEAGDLINLEGYEKTPRIFFEFCKGDYPDSMNVDENPELDYVFNILKEGFPIENSYDLWLTDTSHKIRHNVSKVYLWENTTATQIYTENDIAFFGLIATMQSERGKGSARKLLYWLYDKLKEEGKTAILSALPHRVSFYESIGFKEIYRDILFQKKED